MFSRRFLTWNEFVESVVPPTSGTNFPERDSDDGNEDRGQDEDGSKNIKKRKGHPRKRSSNNRQDRKGNDNDIAHPTMLHFGGDVANELDLLDFIDDDEEKTQIVIKYVLENVVPMLNFSDTADEKEKSTSSSSFRLVSSSQRQQEDESSSESFASSCDNSILELSEQNLLHHNAGALGTLQPAKNDVAPLAGGPAP